MEQEHTGRLPRRQTALLAAGLIAMAGILAACSAGSLFGKQANPSSSPASDPVKMQVQNMTLNDKIGQLVMVGLDGTKVDEQTRAMVMQNRVGGFILYKDNLTGVGQTVELLNELKLENTKADGAAPLLLGVDQEGGRVERLPQPFAGLPTNRAIGSKGSEQLARVIGERLGEEIAMVGFNLDFAPVLDVDSNPRNPVIGDRSYGSTAELVSRLGLAAMEGIRSRSVIPVVKHFPGHGDTSVDSHLALPVVDKSRVQLDRLELAPFAAAVRAQADAIMVAHLLLPQLDPVNPASLSKKVVSDLLRGDLHYDGVVITDDLTMGALRSQGTTGQAAVKAILAGADIVLVAHDYKLETEAVKSLMNSAEAGVLPLSRIDQSVYRILQLKRKFALQDAPLEGQPDVAGWNKLAADTLRPFFLDQAP